MTVEICQEKGDPNIYGEIDEDTNYNSGKGIAFTAHYCCEVVHMASQTPFAQYANYNGVNFFKRIILSAEKSSSVYNKSNTVQPNSLRVYYIIKY